MLDGQPPPPGALELKLYPKGYQANSAERVAKCRVGPEGEYAFSSYRAGDGAEPGEYVLSVEFQVLGFGTISGPDQLGNNFNSPLNTDPRFQVTVVSGEPTVIPAIDIITSELERQPDHPFATPAGKIR